MRSVIFSFVCLAFAVISFQNVYSQDSRIYSNRPYNQYRGRTVLISRNGTITTFTPPPITDERDDNDHGQDPRKVRLDIYYETDCPDSMRFITKELYPLYKEMGNILDIHLIPYGKASESYDEGKQQYFFMCHHGPSECRGNTIQACAMSLYPEEDYLPFIKCMEDYPRPSANGRKCARRLSLDWDKIEKCAKGEEGNRLLHKMAQKTEGLKPSLYFVPWVVVDGVFSERNHRMAQRNLKGVVCNALKESHRKCGQ